MQAINFSYVVAYAYLKIYYRNRHNNVFYNHYFFLVFRCKDPYTYFSQSTNGFSVFFRKILKFGNHQPPPFTTTGLFKSNFGADHSKWYHSNPDLVAYTIVAFKHCLGYSNVYTNNYNHVHC